MCIMWAGAGGLCGWTARVNTAGDVRARAGESTNGCGCATCAGLSCRAGENTFAHSFLRVAHLQNVCFDEERVTVLLRQLTAAPAKADLGKMPAVSVSTDLALSSVLQQTGAPFTPSVDSFDRHAPRTGAPSSLQAWDAPSNLQAAPSWDVLGAACQRVTAVAPTAPIFELCLNELRAALPNEGRSCSDEALVTVSFYASDSTSKRPDFPTAPASAPPRECRFAFVDSSYSSTGPSGNALSWTVVELPRLCFSDEQRAAHFIKASLPLLLPDTRQIVYGDLKCATDPEWATATQPNHSMPLAALRAPADIDLVALEHLGDFTNRTVAAEFEKTVDHLRERGAQPEGTFHDIATLRSMYTREGYNMSVPRVVPDTMCLGWRNSNASKLFACRWSLEVALYSMREQLCFDHALQLSPIRIRWLSKYAMFRYTRQRHEGTA